MFEPVFVVLVVLALFGASVRALSAGWSRRPELGPPLDPLRPGPRRRSRFAGEQIGGGR